MNLVFSPPPSVTVPVAGSNDAFPVRRIYCVGRNYAAHAREMGFDPDREPPFFFCKPADAIVYVAPGTTGQFPYPAQTENCHYEMELVAAIGLGGRDIAPDDALEHVFGYALGLDMTRRDLQMEMRKMGRPWDIGKAFDHSAPIGPIHRAAQIGHPLQGTIWLEVNGQTVQRADIAQLIWPVAETVAYLSHFFELVPGDLIYTGTPEGVGPVIKGDTMHGGIEGLGEFRLDVV
ncbi:fumarylacetoacetate hydrolase family protein [Paraburkholderia hayleyella]|uniref:fumarylacetoacetate hydrolase family protein n=1 Tax=Paraburkholderia hayleyella TaxID=2152889 RepID=UPI001291C81C|nr:fumarylacetoacetate hydrolase family protein [Paraburkholderia hayleyella]